MNTEHLIKKITDIITNGTNRVIESIHFDEDVIDVRIRDFDGVLGGIRISKETASEALNNHVLENYLNGAIVLYK